MVTVANPIYDIVFKYIMQDERIARTILSALLKRDIVNVEIRPHEYAGDRGDALSVFRIDFGATVREADGSEHLILIELQKTWLETETLRFRQYLGVQYQNPKNIVADSRGRHALPTVAVYLLGHKVGDIEEPVLYVRHQPYDYEGRLVTKGLPDPFVDSLTHDSVIVQIPRLHGQVNNRLDKVLSIFDQTRIDRDDQHMLRLDDSLYNGDADMEHIIHSLLKAATDSDVRQDMNVEDEYFSVIEKRDTEILERDRKLAEQKVEIEQKKVEIEQKKVEIEQKKVEIEQKKVEIEQKKVEIEQKDAQLHTSVQLLLKAGTPIEIIAASLNMTTDEVKRHTTY